MFMLVLLPLISFLSGFASLQIDPGKKPKLKWILVALLVSTLLATVASSVHDEQIRKAEKEAANNQRLKDESTINVLRETSMQLVKNSQDLKKSSQDMSGKLDVVIADVQSWGFSPQAVQRLRQSESADKARSMLLQETKNDNANVQTFVTYFLKDVDGPKVLDALRQGGFQVEPKIAGERNPTLATNSVWVGNDVSLEKAKFVALTLIRAGVQLKSFRRLRRGADKRANMIQVGADAAVVNLANLTVADVNKSTLPLRD